MTEIKLEHGRFTKLPAEVAQETAVRVDNAIKRYLRSHGDESTLARKVKHQFCLSRCRVVHESDACGETTMFVSLSKLGTIKCEAKSAGLIDELSRDRMKGALLRLTRRGWRLTPSFDRSGPPRHGSSARSAATRGRRYLRFATSGVARSAGTQ